MAPRRGREEALADLDPEVFGNAPDTAEEDVQRCQRPRARQIVRAVDPFDAAVGSCHQRVVLVAKPEIERQPRVDLPPIPNVERVLPLARGHQLVLDALASAVDEAKQERCVAVVAVRRLGSAFESGRVLRAIQFTARTQAQLRLPVLHPQPVERVATPDFMSSMDLRNICRQRVCAFITLNWSPAVRISQVSE